MHASVSVLAANDFALLKLDERCQSPLVGSLTDRLGMESLGEMPLMLILEAWQSMVLLS